MSDTPASETGHELRDVRFRPVLVGAALIVAMVLLAAAGMVRLHDSLADRQARQSAPANPLAGSVTKLPPEPRLQSHPIADLEVLRAAEQAVLDGYGWLDRDAGLARIPIERAMDLLVERPRAHRETTP